MESLTQQKQKPNVRDFKEECSYSISPYGTRDNVEVKLF